MIEWKPGASLEALRCRAKLMAQLRDFFACRAVLEVDVPLLAKSTVTDLNIDSITASVGLADAFLQTSPEYFMKRLLAAGSGDIYSVGKAFRDAEIGRKHNPEFTLLEWYRCGWDDHQLMQEVVDLVALLIDDPHLSPAPVTKLTYYECFTNVMGFNPHRAELHQLRTIASQVASSDWFDQSRANCLDLIFSLRVEPAMPAGIVVVYDYPQCQAALAQISKDHHDDRVSRRFEVFLDGAEIGNGYLELTDPNEQIARFNEDIDRRDEVNRPSVHVDEKFVASLIHGLPACAGVALGVDRILMNILQAQTIDQVLTFAWPRC